MDAGDKQVGMGTHVRPHNLTQLVMTIQLGVTHDLPQAGRNSRNGPNFPGNSQPRVPGSVSMSVHLHHLGKQSPFHSVKKLLLS